MRVHFSIKSILAIASTTLCLAAVAGGAVAVGKVNSAPAVVPDIALNTVMAAPAPVKFLVVPSPDDSASANACMVLASKAVGHPLADAEAIANRVEVSVRIARKDGQALVLTQEVVRTRLNVEVEGSGAKVTAARCG